MSPAWPIVVRYLGEPRVDELAFAEDPARSGGGCSASGASTPLVEMSRKWSTSSRGHRE